MIPGRPTEKRGSGLYSVPGTGEGTRRNVIPRSRTQVTVSVPSIPCDRWNSQNIV